MTPKALRPLVVDVDYAEEAGAFSKSRILNGAVGGYAPLGNFNWLADGLDEMKAIDMEMIRMDHLLDETFYRVVWRYEGELRFDFSRLNRAIVPILQAGMKPLLCLSYKPPALEPTGTETYPPVNMNEWTEVIETYVEHFKGMGYTGLYWEVWNEPDLTFFFQGTPEQYVDLYVATAQAIKRVDPTARVGGTADSSVTSPGGKLEPLLTHIREHPEVPLDFVSYHDYSDPDGDGHPPFSLDWNVEAVEALLEANDLSPREVFVTEWNLTPSLDTGPGSATDTNVGASALAVKLYNLLKHPGLSRVFFFSPIEGYVPDKIFNGDLGLLTVNYHRKAMYNLLQMISYLGDTRVSARVEGDNTSDAHSYALATRDTETQSTAILAWNYWDRNRTLDLTVNRLPYLDTGQQVRITRYLIDADHANYYRDYASGLRGYPVGLTEALIPVNRTVIPGIESFTGRWSMAPYSVMLILIEPTDGDAELDSSESAESVRPLNLAAGQSVDASSALERVGWDREALVDEIRHSLPNTYGWSSDLVGDPDLEAWVRVDLGEMRDLNTVTLYPRDDYGHEGEGFPVDFKIQGATADAPDVWRDLVVETDYDQGDPARRPQVFRFSRGSYRFIRVIATRLGTADENQYALQFAEIEVSASE